MTKEPQVAGENELADDAAKPQGEAKAEETKATEVPWFRQQQRAETDLRCTLIQCDPMNINEHKNDQ